MREESAGRNASHFPDARREPKRKSVHERLGPEPDRSSSRSSRRRRRRYRRRRRDEYEEGEAVRTTHKHAHTHARIHTALSNTRTRIPRRDVRYTRTHAHLAGVPTFPLLASWDFAALLVARSGPVCTRACTMLKARAFLDEFVTEFFLYHQVEEGEEDDEEEEIEEGEEVEEGEYHSSSRHSKHKRDKERDRSVHLHFQGKISWRDHK